MRDARSVFQRRFRDCLSLFLVSLALAAAPLASEALGSRENAQLTILHLADVYEIAPTSGGKFGGLARVAALERRLAADKGHVLVTLGGDFLSPSVASSVFEGEQMIAALGAMGLDLATLGNHEFDFGPEVLRQRMQEAPWDWVVSNVFDAATGEPFGGAAPWVVRDYDGLSVGFLGLALIGEEITASNREGVEFLDPFATAERYLPALEAAGAEVIVALTHLDFADDVRLAQRFPRIDLILGGHEHFPITTQVESTLITKPGSDARNVARIDISRPGSRGADREALRDGADRRGHGGGAEHRRRRRRLGGPPRRGIGRQRGDHRRAARRGGRLGALRREQPGQPVRRCHAAGHRCRDRHPQRRQHSQQPGLPGG